MAFNFHFVLVLVIVYGTNYSLRFLEDYGIPIVATEILAGIIFGSLLGIISPGLPGYDFLVTLAAFGLLLIMFQAGIELDLGLIRRQPKRIGILGGLTFMIPFLAGAGLAVYLGFNLFAAYLVGIVISTTSLGLVHPLLVDFHLLEYEGGQLILSVTGLNDVLSIIALAYGIALTSPNPLIGAVAVTAALVLFFVVIPLFFLDKLSRIAPPRLAEDPVKTSILLTLTLALLTEWLGIHAILGGFFAGLLLDEITHDNGPDVETATRPIITLAASAFFFYVGMNFSISSLYSAGLGLIALVIIVGIGSKFVSALIGGFTMDIGRKTTLLLAATMPGRLSLSVAAAEIGRSRGLISSTLYDAFIILSTISVFITVATFQYFMRFSKSEAGEEIPTRETTQTE
ncbi:cation:proton antiporter [Haladaptatus halobius]|uniref:cation:proton antiporter n=1 Tax=Haladaptatus halobius TaxID=2884875 RepID=UPI001D0B3557|nr:cation:proton antiporter [Haladaptatus halobius]